MRESVEEVDNERERTMNECVGTGAVDEMFLAGFLAYTREMLHLSGERLHAPGDGVPEGEGFLPGISASASDRKEVEGAWIVTSTLRGGTKKKA